MPPMIKSTTSLRFFSWNEKSHGIALAQKGWSSIHSVINENDFWGVIDQLKLNGAEGILIVPIQKMVL